MAAPFGHPFGTEQRRASPGQDGHTTRHSNTERSGSQEKGCFARLGGCNIGDQFDGYTTTRVTGVPVVALFDEARQPVDAATTTMSLAYLARLGVEDHISSRQSCRKYGIMGSHQN